MKPFAFLIAASANDAVAQHAQSDRSSFIAGGTNLVDLMRENVSRPDTLIDITRLSEMATIEDLPGGGLRLGALVRNADTAYHPAVERRYPLLSQAILAGASPQIRNMATNGGNLLQRTRCYYFYDTAMPCNKRAPGSGCPAVQGYNRIHAILGQSEHCIAVFPSDMCVALAALEAKVNVRGPNGTRQMEFADFHRLPGKTPQVDNTLAAGELVTSIDLPAEDFSAHSSYLKLRDRDSYAFALVSVATALEFDGDRIARARFALGGVAHKPWRRQEAETFLVGKMATPETFAAAAQLLLEGATSYEHNAFKPLLAERAIVRNGLAARSTPFHASL
ncbi:MAG TPA: xanthine dehydrogenase family protein subunit M [Opitutaceae bacterium]|nr:xanthine dehydrogenase family protein subunit M [Opitutaceae bacterium]